MFVLWILLLIVTLLSLISQNLSLMQTTKQVNPHPHITPLVNMWSVAFSFSIFCFFFLCHLLDVSACICHIAWGGPSGVDHTNGGKMRMESNYLVSHATMILQYHSSMLALQNSVISRVPHVWYYGRVPRIQPHDQNTFDFCDMYYPKLLSLLNNNSKFRTNGPLDKTPNYARVRCL